MFKVNKISSSYAYSSSLSVVYTGSNGLLWADDDDHTINTFIYNVDDSNFSVNNKYYCRYWINNYNNFSGSFSVIFTSSLGEFTSSHEITSGSEFTMSYNYVYEDSWFGTSDNLTMVTQSMYDPNYNYFDFDITDMYSSSVQSGLSSHSASFYVGEKSNEVNFWLFSHPTLTRYYPTIIEKYQIKETGSLPSITEYTSSNYDEYVFKTHNNKKYYNSESYSISMSCYPKYYVSNSFDNWSIYDDTDWVYRHPELYYRINEYYPDYKTVPYEIDENFQWLSWNSSSNFFSLDFDSLEEGYYSVDLYDKDNDTYYNNTMILRVDK